MPAKSKNQKLHLQSEPASSAVPINNNFGLGSGDTDACKGKMAKQLCLPSDGAVRWGFALELRPSQKTAAQESGY